MIVFGYAKDIAPIKSIRLHTDHVRLYILKAGLKQRRAPREINRLYERVFSLRPQETICEEKIYFVTFVTFHIKRLHTLVPVKWQPYDDELLTGTIREPLLSSFSV